MERQGASKSIAILNWDVPMIMIAGAFIIDAW
jgi:hypothetical protein